MSQAFVLSCNGIWHGCGAILIHSSDENFPSGFHYTDLTYWYYCPICKLFMQRKPCPKCGDGMVADVAEVGYRWQWFNVWTCLNCEHDEVR
jgi:hypothetical protein